MPDRVVVLGAGGFVGAAICGVWPIAGTHVAALTRQDVDLQSDGAGDKLAGLLKPSDTLVCVSAIAPVKNAQMLRDNLV